MKKIVLLAGLVALSWTMGMGCIIDGGDGGVVVPGDCNDNSCMYAMTAGLPLQNVVLCDPAADTAYGNLLECACTGGSCADVCSDNLCSDNGATTPCLDCLALSECVGEQTACANY